jgi:hypothetical protein
MSGDDSSTWSESEWRAFFAGYEIGVMHGVDLGRAQANQEWTDVTTLACRTALTGDGLTHAERRRRRAERTGPLAREPLTPQQIRVQAARSWGAPTFPPIGPDGQLLWPRRRPDAA